MFVNYFKAALRNLVKSRGNSVINIVGLSVGIAVALLIGLWIYDELSFDKYHKNYDRIVQVMQHQNFNGGVRTDKAVPIPLSIALRQSFPDDFKYVVMSSWTNSHLLSVGEKTVSRSGNFMESEAADMLTLKMVEGTARGLSDPSSILISHSLSQTLFGHESAIGKLVKLDSDNLKVIGVYDDLPSNATFNNLAFIASWQLFVSADENKSAFSDWNQNSFQLFAQVADDKDVRDVSGEILDI
jgi:hypothetical protein